MTSFYFPGWRTAMKMDPDESDSSSSDEEMKSVDGEENKNNQPVGFVGTETNDMPYASLMDHHNIYIVFEDLNWFPKPVNNNKIEWSVEKNRGALFECRRENILFQIKTEIVLNWKYKGKSRAKEAEERFFEKKQIDNVLCEFEKISKASKRIRKSINMSRPKLTWTHIQQIRVFVE